MDGRTDFLMRKLTLELNKLAIKYKKTKDPSIGVQWYKKLKEIPVSNKIDFKKKIY